MDVSEKILIAGVGSRRKRRKRKKGEKNERERKIR